MTDFLADGRIMILDGATGTMIQKCGLTEEDFRAGIPDALREKELKGNNECLNLSRPDIIRKIHNKYIAAGADIIEANTFSANRISQEEYGCGALASRMAYEGARIAREAADAAMETFRESGKKAETGKKIFVAGSIGPTSKSLSMSPDMNDPAFRAVTFDEMADAYGEQIRGLILGGADMLLIETCFDALNAKAAIYALEKLLDSPDFTDDPAVRTRLDADGYFPVIVSVSVSDRSGRTLTGQTLEAFYTAVSHYPLTAFGLNCSLGAGEMHHLLRETAAFAKCPVICYPNAGLPDGMGGYAQTPEEMAGEMGQMAAEGILNIAGGCCGTTPEYIRAIEAAVRKFPARKIPGDDKDTRGMDNPDGRQCTTLTVSGLEAVCIDRRTRNFTNVGERTNVAGSRKFARLIASGNLTEALGIAAGQVDSGADIIDINMDDAMLDSEAEMTRFVRSISSEPAAAKAALMIDSSDWKTILSGLKNAQGKSIVNSISLKEGEEAFIGKAREIRRLGAAMVVMAFDEQGQATDFSRKTEICARAYRLLTERAGIAPHDIIFDVNVLAIGTGIEEHADYAADFIRAVKWIKENLPGALTSGGISNLSFAFRGNNTVREAMHSAFLYHAIRAGLDMAIVNPGMLQVYDNIEPGLLKCVEDVIFNTDSGATERLIEKAADIAAAASAEKAEKEKTGSDGRMKGKSPHNSQNGQSPTDGAEKPWKRLAEALVSGRADSLRQDLEECLKICGSATGIIEGPLMDGMKKVGELFGDGKMFLPQVVKSAKVMKDAVDYLQPYMDSDSDAADNGRTDAGMDGTKTSGPKIVIATVRGDVHDIGKNITATVLRCNGFNVIDLGVMVDRDTILDTAVREHADIIAASGLITPSLYQMEELCREMTARGMDIPLFIGGATTSALHTAVKLAPLYEHVFYGADASASAVMAKRCMADRVRFEQEEHEAQEKMRTIYRSGKSGGGQTEGNGAGPHDAEKVFPPESYLRDTSLEGPHADRVRTEDIPVGEISIREVLPWFDWKMFYAIWGIKYGKMSPDAPEMAGLRQEAEAVLREMTESGTCRIAAGVKWYGAYSRNDDIILAGKASGNINADSDLTSADTGETRLPMLRQEEPSPLPDGRKVCLSLCDFVPQEEYGFTSPVGAFAISVTDSRKGRPDGAPSDTGKCGCRECSCGPDYGSMLRRSVMNTLAEAASSWIDYRIGGDSGHWKIIKPAAGYASCPDHTLKRDILHLLPDSEKLGITLTESCGMIPEASVCGMIFIHRNAMYPDIRIIDRKQYEDYAARRGMTDEEARRFLGHLLRPAAPSIAPCP